MLLGRTASRSTSTGEWGHTRYCENDTADTYPDLTHGSPNDIKHHLMISVTSCFSASLQALGRHADRAVAVLQVGFQARQGAAVAQD